VGALPTWRISVNRPEKCRGAPGGVVAESCKVILTARPRADADLIERACTVAARCHQGQTRYSGDPYITHPVAVASILARLHDVDVVDDPTLCAAILHDTVEDTPYTLAALKRDFCLERSTSRPDPVKAELRTMLYELFDAALRTSGVGARRRDGFADRGDGLLALIDPADQELVLNAVIPVFSQLLTSYNAGLSDPGDRDRHLRVRIVVHTGNIHDDDNGCFGEALDTAFRLLDTPRAKMALKAARGALVAVISADVWESAAPNGFAGTIRVASRQPVTTQVGGHEYQGWLLLPSQAA
jgi:hypothetical protein